MCLGLYDFTSFWGVGASQLGLDKYSLGPQILVPYAFFLLYAKIQRHINNYYKIILNFCLFFFSLSLCFQDNVFHGLIDVDKFI